MKLLSLAKMYDQLCMVATEQCVRLVLDGLAGNASFRMTHMVLGDPAGEPPGVICLLQKLCLPYNLTDS